MHLFVWSLYQISLMHGHGLFNIGKLHFLYLSEYAVQKNHVSHISAVKRIIMY